MMRSKKQQAAPQAIILTEGLYQGVFTATVLDPFFGYEVATSTASLNVTLVKNTPANNLFCANIIIKQCTYSPEYLSYLFPEINIKTTAKIKMDEISKEVRATGMLPFSDHEVTGSLDLTQDLDGSIRVKSSLTGFSIFAKLKKHAVVAANELTQDLPDEAISKKP